MVQVTSGHTKRTDQTKRHETAQDDTKPPSPYSPSNPAHPPLSPTPPTPPHCTISRPRAWPTKAFVFAAVFAALGAGTVAVLGGLSSLEALLPAGWYSIWAYTWAPLLGGLFAFAGVSHFTLLKEFCNIYPGRGAWGFWYLPGTASFHVKWTGVAEFAGGLGLLLGGLGVGVEFGLEQAAAAGLFALTLAVTPANVYMFSHGAQLPEGLEVPVAGHAIRGFLQCVLLAIFYTIAQGSG